MRKIEVPVFIAGAGPTGLTATCLLATQGIETLTITRYPGTANSPRAHITNQRTMEVFRDLGIEPRVMQASTPSELMSNNIWATSFAGTEIARLQTWGTLPERKADYELASPSGMCNIPQHLMEPILLDVARERGGKFLFNTELISMKQDAEQVHAICRDRITGEEFEVVSQYAIGADGDNSVVVKEIGFPTEGQMGLGAAVNVWVEADLTKYVAHRPGVLYWMTQPGNNYWVGSGTWISVRPWDEWVLLFMYDPSQGEPDLSEAALQERARATIGDPEIPIRIKAVSKWTINQVVAKNMNKGRVLIAGNAAAGKIPAEIAVVISNNPNAPGLEKARARGIPAVVVPSKGLEREAYDRLVVAELEKHQVDLVCLAGFMRLLSAYFVRQYPNRILNIHPALLPSFPGLEAQRQALEHGVKITGCTVHFVDEFLDAGPILAQRAVEVRDDDTEETLAARILEQEHIIYTEAINLALSGRYRIEGRRVLRA
jgi:formyltetrahydrofolate-dependent phosphoribosylglycinamide formyltransferase